MTQSNTLGPQLVSLCIDTKVTFLTLSKARLIVNKERAWRAGVTTRGQETCNKMGGWRRSAVLTPLLQVPPRPARLSSSQEARQPCWTSQAWTSLPQAPHTQPLPLALATRAVLSSSVPRCPCLMTSSCLWVRKRTVRDYLMAPAFCWHTAMAPCSFGKPMEAMGEQHGFPILGEAPAWGD